MSVLVVVSTSEEAGPLVRWGARFARARKATLKVLHVSRGAKPGEPKVMLMRDATDKHPVRQAIREAVGGDLVKQMTQRFNTQQIRRALELERERDEKKKELADLAGEEASAPEALARLKQTDQAIQALRTEGFLTVRAVSHPSREEAVLAEIKEVKATLLIVGKHEKAADEASDLGLQLLASAPCDMMLLRASGQSGERCERVLIPAAGGPHAQVALKLAGGLAETDGAEVYPLYVGSGGAGDDGEDEEVAKELGRRSLERSLKQAGVTKRTTRLKPTVVLASSPQAGISRAAKDGYDLVLVGASNQGFMARVLFGTVPARLLSGEGGTTGVAVVRKARPLSTRALEALDAVLQRWFPPLQRDDRITLFESLQSGSRFTIDFAMLIALSTGIAALGLMQNSGAVVIGAMLVAPLMTPMIGAGLALVQGNTLLVRDAFRTIAKGFFLALGIGTAAGLLGDSLGFLPGHQLTPELLARGAPTGLDLVVAFLSGLAAAYALARPNLSGALPGVAIAAALVPPLSTVGIALSVGKFEVASGAALLFGTNLVAIVLGAAAVFRAIGVHGSKAQGSGRLWARRLLMVLLITAIGLAGWFISNLPILIRGVEGKPIVISERLRHAIESRVVRDPSRTVLGIGLQSDSSGLLVVVGADGTPRARLKEDLTEIASNVLRRETTVRVLYVRYEAVGEAEEEVPEIPGIDLPGPLRRRPADPAPISTRASTAPLGSRSELAPVDSRAGSGAPVETRAGSVAPVETRAGSVAPIETRGR